MARDLAESGEEVRIYACGGDGTANEVANGIAGYENAAMTVIPTGTGNDLLKNFGADAAKFADAENLWDGDVHTLDLIDCNGRLGITIACCGLDARVAEDVHRYGKSPLLGGMGSYSASVAVNFFGSSITRRWTLRLDGGEPQTGDYTLAALCSGRYYGGGFFPVPEARMDDGLLHAVVVKKVTRPQFLRLIGPYSKGKHASLPPELISVQTAEELHITAEEDVTFCLDGECRHAREVRLRRSEKRLNFFAPKGSGPNATAAGAP